MERTLRFLRSLHRFALFLSSASTWRRDKDAPINMYANFLGRGRIGRGTFSICDHFPRTSYRINGHYRGRIYPIFYSCPNTIGKSLATAFFQLTDDGKKKRPSATIASFQSLDNDSGRFSQSFLQCERFSPPQRRIKSKRSAATEEQSAS